MCYRKIGLTTIAVTQDLHSGMPVVLIINKNPSTLGTVYYLNANNALNNWQSLIGQTQHTYSGIATLIVSKPISVGRCNSTPEPAGVRVEKNHPPSLLLLRALRPGAARPLDGFGAPGNVWLVLYNKKKFTRGYDTKVVILLITLARDDSNPGPPKIYMCPICSKCITNNKKYTGSVLCISCKDWVHTTCTTFATKQYTNTWTCTKCNAQATRTLTAPLALRTTHITPVRPTIIPHSTIQDNSTPNSPSHTQ